MAKYYPNISEPVPEPQSLQQTVSEIKEALEILLRQRKPTIASAVTFQDLIDLGIITPSQVPK